MFWLRNKKNNFQLCTLIWGPECTARFRIVRDKVRNDKMSIYFSVLYKSK